MSKAKTKPDTAAQLSEKILEAATTATNDYMGKVSVTFADFRDEPHVDAQRAWHWKRDAYRAGYIAGAVFCLKSGLSVKKGAAQ